MKSLIVLSALVTLAVGYTSVSDDLDIDTAISQPETLKAWFNCFVDLGPCDQITGPAKADMPEAIQQACAKCTPAQKVILKKFLGALKQQAPADYEVYKKKYDPENNYFGALQKAIA